MKISFDEIYNGNLNNQIETIKNFYIFFVLDEEATAHNLENLLKLPTRWGDTVSPGSSAKLADGAAACVLMNEKGIQKYAMKFSHNVFFILLRNFIPKNKDNLSISFDI